MRTISYLISFLLLAACTETPSKAPLTLWYDKPAQNWDEALPIGNGRAGAMVFGGVEKEQLQLNEKRVCRNTRFTLFSLSTIRALLTFSSSDILKIISIFCSQ